MGILKVDYGYCGRRGILLGTFPRLSERLGAGLYNLDPEMPGTRPRNMLPVAHWAALIRPWQDPHLDVLLVRQVRRSLKYLDLKHNDLRFISTPNKQSPRPRGTDGDRQRGMQEVKARLCLPWSAHLARASLLGEE